MKRREDAERHYRVPVLLFLSSLLGASLGRRRASQSTRAQRQHFSDRAPLAAWTVMTIKLSQGSCVKRPVLGGLHHEYRVEEIAQHNPIPQEERS